MYIYIRRGNRRLYLSLSDLYALTTLSYIFFFFFQAEDGIRDVAVTGVQTCALPILRPVLLLDVRVVVLFVRPSPRELDLPCVAPALQMVVDELAAIIRVHTQQRKGQLRGDLV